MIKWSTTSRGFRIGDFVDMKKNECSIQEIPQYKVPVVYIGVPTNEQESVDGIYIDQDQAIELIDALRVFVETDHLPREKEEL